MYNFAKSSNQSKDPYNFSIGSTAPVQAPKQIKQTAPVAQQQQQKAKVDPPQKKSQSQKSKIVPSDFVPTRFGLNYNPAAIILEYILHGKLYHHKMKLYKLEGETPTNHALEYLKKKHYQYFMGNKIPDKQIASLIEKLKQRIKMGKANVNKPTSASSNRPQTASTMSSSTQKIPEKAQPQKLSNSNQIQMKKEFEDYGLGEEDDDDSYDEKHKIQQSKIPAKPIGQSIQKGQTSCGGQNSNNKYQDDYNEEEYDEEYGEQDEEEEGDDYDEMDEDEYRRLYEQMGYNNLDLNKMSNEELNKHKALMEQLYLKNIKRPGDPGYQYDVQAVYNPTMDNEWDMDEDDDADIV